MNHDHNMMAAVTTTVLDIVATATGLVPPAAATTEATAKSAGMGGAPKHIKGVCRISMLWNWYTIDSCFIARSWHNRTKTAFAFSCIGIFLICILLEFIRRVQRNYDRRIIRKYQLKANEPAAGQPEVLPSPDQPEAPPAAGNPPGCHPNPPIELVPVVPEVKAGPLHRVSWIAPLGYSPSFLEQFIRSLFYVLQFSAAYLIMLMAMYYNGYIIICIVIGVFLGHFLFGSDNMTAG